MSTLTGFFHPPIERIRRWLHGGAEHPSDHPEAGLPQGPGVDTVPNPGHAPGHRHLGPPPDLPEPHTTVPLPRQHHPAWLGTGGRVDRLRRNERHGDEKY